MKAAKQTLFKYIKAGAITAAIVMVLNVIWYLAYKSFADITVIGGLSIFSVVIASIVAPIVGALVYYFFSRKFKAPTILFLIFTLVLTVISCIPIMSDTFFGEITYIDSLRTLIIPMHAIAGLLTAIVVPIYVRKVGK